MEAKQFEYNLKEKMHHENHNHTMPHATEQEKHDETVIYTCPMHPEVRKTEPGKCPGCGMDLIPASAKALAGMPRMTCKERAIWIMRRQ